MGDLARDTAVEGGEGRYLARLSREWEIWGPCGGYVAAIAFRAAAAESRLPRPASFACHYLGVGEFREVEIEVRRLGGGKRAESLRVSMTQGGRALLEGLAWFAADGDGLRHDTAPAPEVPDPDALKSWEDLGYPSHYEFWRNVEARPFDWVGAWDDRPGGEPVYRQWYRFRPRATFEDAAVDAARLLVALDILPWPAAAMAYRGRLPYIAPSLDLTVRFHRAVPESDWLLCAGEAPIAEDGLVSGSARVWSRDGRLLASGEQHMLCRPAPAGMP